MKRIANRPIVCHVLDALRAAGTRELALAVPSEALDEVSQSVKEECASDIDITYLAQDGSRDLRGALAAIEPFVGDEACVVHAADGIGQPLPAVSDVLGDGSPDIALFLHRGTDGGPPLGLATERLLRIAELDSSRSALGLAGVCFLGPGALRQACGAPPSSSDDDLIAIAERVASGGGRLLVRHLRPWRRYSGDPSDLLEMNRIVLDQLAPETEMFERGESQIEGRVVIDPSAEVSTSVIHGPVVIGARARVSNSYVGPYTSIARDVVIEGAELERSIVAEGATIKHLCERIAASTVGPGACIVRDFGVPRGMRLHVGEGVQIALS